MINPDLERRYVDCLELVDTWRGFLDIINRVVKGGGAVSQEAEQYFLNNKARIAMLHDSFTASAKHDKQTAANMIEIVNRAITLRTVKKMSDSEARKMEIEWHEVFLLLNETVSSLNEDRQDLANVNEMTFKMKRYRENVVVRIKAFVGSFYFKLTVTTVVILFVLFGIPALGIYDYDDLREIKQLKPVISKVYNFTRITLGAPLAYTEMKQFTGPLTKLPMKRMSDIKSAVTDQTKDRDKALPIVTLGDTNIRDALLKAQEFDAYDFYGDGVSGNKGRIFIFWFNETADAKNVERIVRASPSHFPPNLKMNRMINVMTFTNAQDTSFIADIEEQGLDRLTGRK
ncbi:hypothetical protein BH09SUM1_BH09SUM1_02310 [soil metagenome]